MKEVLDFLKKTPLVTGVLALGLTIGGILLVHIDGLFVNGLYRLILSFAAGAFLYLITKERSFEKSTLKSSGYTIKRLLAFVIFSFALGVMLFFYYMLYQKIALEPAWYLNILTTAFFCLGVGLFEELIFRAVLNDAIICQFRKSKGVFLVAAIVPSFIFGYVHVIREDITNPELILPIALKTLSTGMMGVALTFLYWKTRNIVGIAMVHAIYDFCPIAPTVIFQTGQELGNYASTADGKGQPVVWYVVQIVLEAIVLICLWKKVVKTIDFKKMREEW